MSTNSIASDSSQFWIKSIEKPLIGVLITTLVLSLISSIVSSICFLHAFGIISLAFIPFICSLTAGVFFGTSGLIAALVAIVGIVTVVILHRKFVNENQEEDQAAPKQKLASQVTNNPRKEDGNNDTALNEERNKDIKDLITLAEQAKNKERGKSSISLKKTSFCSSLKKITNLFTEEQQKAIFQLLLVKRNPKEMEFFRSLPDFSFHIKKQNLPPKLTIEQRNTLFVLLTISLSHEENFFQMPLNALDISWEDLKQLWSNNHSRFILETLILKGLFWKTMVFNDPNNNAYLNTEEDSFIKFYLGCLVDQDTNTTRHITCPIPILASAWIPSVDIPSFVQSVTSPLEEILPFIFFMPLSPISTSPLMIWNTERVDKLPLDFINQHLAKFSVEHLKLLSDKTVLQDDFDWEAIPFKYLKDVVLVNPATRLPKLSTEQISSFIFSCEPSIFAHVPESYLIDNPALNDLDQEQLQSLLGLSSLNLFKDNFNNHQNKELLDNAISRVQKLTKISLLACFKKCSGDIFALLSETQWKFFKKKDIKNICDKNTIVPRMFEANKNIGYYLSVYEGYSSYSIGKLWERIGEQHHSMIMMYGWRRKIPKAVLRDCPYFA